MRTIQTEFNAGANSQEAMRVSAGGVMHMPAVDGTMTAVPWTTDAQARD
jgi:hypothetical protein